MFTGKLNLNKLENTNKRSLRFVENENETNVNENENGNINTNLKK